MSAPLLEFTTNDTRRGLVHLVPVPTIRPETACGKDASRWPWRWNETAENELRRVGEEMCRTCRRELVSA